MEKETMFDKILEIDDFYSLVDYAEFNNVNTCLVSDLYNVNTNGLNSIRINFNIGNQSKEIVVKKSTAKRIYTFIQIIHNDLRMNILVKNTEHGSILVEEILSGNKNKVLNAKTFWITKKPIERKQN